MRERLIALPVVLLVGALFFGGCCTLSEHHQRRLGPDNSQVFPVEDTELSLQLGKKILRFGSERGRIPAVLLLHEIGGLTPETLELGERLRREGYTVYAPVLFGNVGERKPDTLARCWSHDFNCLASSASPLAHELLNKLLPHLAARHPVLGVIGMCVTGNFPFALLQNKAVKAAVASQPALPLFRKSAIGLSSREIKAIRARLDHGEAKVLYLRYSQDCLSSTERLEAFKQTFAGRIDSRVFPACNSEHHAVLTDSLTETPEAWQCLTAFLAESLQGRVAAPGACVSQAELDRQNRLERCGK